MRDPPSSGTVAEMLRSLLALAALAHAPAALAQAVPPRAPEVSPPAAPKAATDSDDLDDDGDAPPKKPAPTKPEAEPSRREAPKNLPPPADPRADEQAPRPFLAKGSDEAERHVEVGPDVGLWSRPAKGDGVSYAPGFAWGIHARAELHRYLGFRAYLSNAKHAVDAPRGSLGLSDTQVDQPDLEVIQLGARAEPTLMPTPTLRLWAGLGIAWARATAPEPSSSGAVQIRSADRSGVLLEYSAALGATWDVVPRWLAATVSASGGLVADQTGDLFQDRAVGDGAGGTTTLGAMPELAGSYAVQLGLGMIL